MKIEFSTSNSAFEDYAEEEITRILENIINKVNQGSTYGSIQDINGNTIGKWEM